MRFSILGFDRDTLCLARWAVEQAGHQLTAAYAAPGEAQEVRSIAPTARLTDAWEELLSGQPSAAFVIVSAAHGAQRGKPNVSELRFEQLKRLAQAKAPLLVVTPACQAIEGFEVEMIRHDLNGVIVPYSPGLLHPAIDKLAEFVAAGDTGPIGRVEQVSLERDLADRSRGAILFQLARDIGLIRRLIGPVQTVTASEPTRAIGRDPLGPKPKELPPLQNLSVMFSSDAGLTARWIAGPATVGPQGRLILAGQRGKAILTMPVDGDWSLDVAGDQYSTEEFAAGADLARVFDPLSRSTPPEARYDDSAWLSACRDQEAAEAVDRSLLRGRTIELFREEHTEAASFKGIMAMGGCLLLVLAICMLILVTLVEGLQLPLRKLPVWRMWPFFLLAPIGGFLLLQLLGFAVQGRSPDRAEHQPPATTD